MVDAFLTEVAAGDGRPTIDAVAARAGVSARSVFRHFGDLDGLIDAAIDRQIERLAPLAQVPAHDGSLAARIDALVVSRCRLNEAATPVRRVVQSVRRTSPRVDDSLRLGAELLRAQVVDLFAAELDPLDRAARARVVAAVEAATSWPTWQQLRDDQGLAEAVSRDVVRRLVAGVLT